MRRERTQRQYRCSDQASSDNGPRLHSISPLAEQKNLSALAGIRWIIRVELVQSILVGFIPDSRMRGNHACAVFSG
jgi:hypothetical protein